MDRRLGLLWIALSILGAAVVPASASGAGDWRKQGSEREQLDALVELVPGTSHWMIEMGERYKNLYWAAKLEKWEFAAYQAEEMESLILTVARARPSRAASAEQFRQNVFPWLHEQVRRRDWESFQAGFQKLNSECMACHIREDHPFVTIPLEPITPSSPVLNRP